MRVAIVALGWSGTEFVRFAELVGDWRTEFDEIWTINGFGNILQCDRVFHMDDVRVQEARAAAGNKKIANMLAWMKRHPGPIYTSRLHPDYPGLVEYPLEAVINSCGAAYFNGTVAYAVALAIHEKASSIAVYGADYVYPNGAHEKGRACLEFWLGNALARGVKIAAAEGSQLLDNNASGVLYGYDTLKVSMTRGADGFMRVKFEEKAPPTAKEIEARYDKRPKQHAASDISSMSH